MLVGIYEHVHPLENMNKYKTLLTDTFGKYDNNVRVPTKYTYLFTYSTEYTTIIPIRNPRTSAPGHTPLTFSRTMAAISHLCIIRLVQH